MHRYCIGLCLHCENLWYMSISSSRGALYPGSNTVTTKHTGRNNIQETAKDSRSRRQHTNISSLLTLRATLKVSASAHQSAGNATSRLRILSLTYKLLFERRACGQPSTDETIADSHSFKELTVTVC